MDWRESARRRLPEHLDAQGDLRPPWAEFPTYERYSIGWRMGGGESWLMLWHVFLRGLPRDRSNRLAYLRRHPPAPLNWSESVYRVLHPDWTRDEDEDEDDDEDDAGLDPADLRQAELRAQGLVASDASYAIWRSSDAADWWPWQSCRSPRVAARHWTRDLWFWSRRIAEQRAAGALEVPRIPWAWRGCAEPLRTGEPGRISRRRGLLTLARTLAAGAVVAPWHLGLGVDDFADSFDDDMGYVDAYRLWGMSAIDDADMLERFCQPATAPKAWQRWLSDRFYLR